MPRRYHLSSSLVTTMLLISSVLMTPMTQTTPLKMTSETYKYRVGLHVPNIYMKFNDPFPSARAFKPLLCSTSNKGRLICKHLTQSADAEMSTLLALTALTCQPKNQCRITVSISLRQTPFSFLHVHCINYSGPVGPLSSTQLTQIYICSSR